MCFAIDGAAADPSSLSLKSWQQGLSKAPMPPLMLHGYLTCLFSCTPDNPPPPLTNVPNVGRVPVAPAAVGAGGEGLRDKPDERLPRSSSARSGG